LTAIGTITGLPFKSQRAGVVALVRDRAGL
jgi:hypothetical protein